MTKDFCKRPKMNEIIEDEWLNEGYEKTLA